MARRRSFAASMALRVRQILQRCRLDCKRDINPPIRRLFIDAKGLPINLAGKVAILASTSLSQALLDSLRLSEEYKFAVMKSPAPEVPGVKGHATGEDAPMKVALQFVKAMEANGIEVTIAGSLARNVVTEPRFTKDIDVNLRLGPGSVDKFVAAATAVGADLRSEIGRPRRGRGEVFLVGISYSGIPIDVFFNTWWGSQDAVDDAFLVEVDGQAWRFISPTSLCLFKILFLSESSPERVLLKHIEDIYALLEVSKIPVDRRYVSASVSKLLPSTDFRFKLWHGIARGEKLSSILAGALNL